MSKPNREVIERWVEALRSGRYKQGRGQLRSFDDEFCCLGVLCDLHAKEHGYEWEEDSDGLCDYLYDGCGAVLPLRVVRWAGLDGCNPSIEGVSLTDHNDGDIDPYVPERSFNEIADMIEREWLG